MATITEDYVSFEVAKLLKEKGFDEQCSSTYDIAVSGGKPKFYKYDALQFFPNGMKNSDDKYDMVISAPTHQMAMKWLREVHHLYINVGFGNDYKGEFLYMGDIYDLTKDAIHAKYEPIIEADDYLSDNPKTYEEACEAAIKYCLKNLI